MLQSVDWGAVAFGIVLVELDGKNATKDTGVRHLLAAQGHVDQLVKVTPVLCEHCAPIPYPSISRGSGFAACSLSHAAQAAQAPLGSPARSPQGAHEVQARHFQHRCTMGAQAPSAAPKSGATPASYRRSRPVNSNFKVSVRSGCLPRRSCIC